MVSAEIATKSGPDLFKEILRLYSSAEVEDYYKNGVWKNDVMKTDWELLRLHRKEAGAPEPPPVDELDLEIPNLPGANPAGSVSISLKPLAALAPGGAKTAGTSPGAVKLSSLPSVRPVTPVAAVTAGTNGATPVVVAATVGTSPSVGKVKVADKDVMSKSGVELFKEVLRWYPVADVDDYLKAGTWKDELMRTDIELVRLHRKEAGSPDPIPLEAVVLPEIPSQEPVKVALSSPVSFPKANSFGNASVVAPTPPLTGVKRPLTVPPTVRPVVDTSKKPRLSLLSTPTLPTGFTARPAVIPRTVAATTPAGPGGTRPLKLGMLRPVGSGIVLRKH
jgi:hypothetical protein|eukprot:TRINITY_DN673_c0_g1_i1.p1 TRINITY_DN673_c0_g1~~TRINITY_DN673_c0_g1_i1.p1  ORF type:complete len:335 (-),score=49.86 TRINITY_DN673_c0_g1_i1:374-1378(-)